MKNLFYFLFFLSTFSQAQKLSLEDCYEYAIKNHPELSNKTIDIEKEKQKTELTKKDWLPTIGTGYSQGGSLGRNIDLYSNDVVTKGIHYNSLSLNSSITLYNGGKYGISNKKQKENQNLSQYNYLEAIQVKKREIVNLFYQVLMDRAAIEIQENRLLEIESQKADLEELIKEGLKPKSDLLEFELLQSQEVFNNERLKNVLKNNLQRLSNALFYKKSSSLDITDSNINKSLNHGFFQCSPQFLRLLAQQSINNIDRNLLKANYLPSINLNINSGTSYSSAAPPQFTLGKQLNSNLGQYASFSLNFPIFNKGQRVNYQEMNRLEKVQIQNSLNAQKNILESEVELIESELELSTIQLQSLNNQILSHKTIQEVQKEKYLEGLITYSELNTWQTRYYQAQIDLKIAEYQNKILLALLALY
jgi:outer membrane protein